MFRQTPKHLDVLTIKRQARVPYHGLGFLKCMLDGDIYKDLLNHFNVNARRFQCEQVDDYLHTTHPSMSPSLMYEDPVFNSYLSSALKPAHEAWCGFPLVEASCYGIRVYQRGSYLYSHVDTITTHVISASICIDAQLDKPWPFYIEDIKGVPHELSLLPGEMIFYESAKLKHARPYPLEGDYYAAIFVHYTPVGWPVTYPDC